MKQQHKSIYKWLLMILMVFTFSCKKENTPEPQNETAKVAVKIVDLICYPYDSISLTFRIDPVDSGKTLNYQWINPDTLIGEGPFTLNIKTNVLLDLEIMDSKNNKTKFQYEIKKDTIDSLKYDYRNSMIGKYGCDVINTWFYPDKDGHWTSGHEYSKSNVEVSKSTNFRLLKISNLQADMLYKFQDHSFNGYHGSGHFKADSIFINTQPGLGPYWYSYKGKKIAGN